MNEIPIAFNHIVWYSSAFFYLFVLAIIVNICIILFYHKKMIKKNNEIKLYQQQHTAKIDNIRKDHADKMETLRIDMLRLEEDKSRQWMESEKETMHILNGISNLLDLSERIGKAESDKVLNLLQEIRDKIENIINQ